MRDSAAAADHDDTLSVVIPYFQQPERVSEAVESVLRQTLLVDRVVVISDGDGTVPAARLRRLDPQRVVVHQLTENRGHLFAREVARRALTSRWVGFVDADDLVEPRWAEALTASAQQHDGVAFCANRHIYSFGRFSRTRRISPVLTDRAAIDGPRPKHFASHATVYRHDRITAAGGFDPGFRVGFDTLFINLIALTGPFGVVDEPLYIRRRKDLLVRRKSLTQHPTTGKGSPPRVEAVARVDELYGRFAPLFRADPDLALRALLAERDPGLETQVVEETDRLRAALRTADADG